MSRKRNCRHNKSLKRAVFNERILFRVSVYITVKRFVIKLNTAGKQRSEKADSADGRSVINNVLNLFPNVFFLNKIRRNNTCSETASDDCDLAFSGNFTDGVDIFSEIFRNFKRIDSPIISIVIVFGSEI